MPSTYSLPLSTMPANVQAGLNLTPNFQPITQEQVNLWSANLQAQQPGFDMLDWVGRNPFIAFGIGAAALLLLIPRGRR